jgi:hypothetical protein
MYNEEFLPDDHYFELDDMTISIDGSNSMDSEEIDRKKKVKMYKMTDPDFYSFKIKEYNEEGEYILRNTDVYSSPFTGYIRNATTGIREKHRVGSKYEDLYFRVKDVALYTKTELNKEPRKLFYRNPEEYERHFGLTVSMDIKNAWHEKNMKARHVLDV